MANARWGRPDAARGFRCFHRRDGLLSGIAMNPGPRRWFDLGRLAALVALFAVLLAGAMPMPGMAMGGMAMGGMAMGGMDPSQAPICHRDGPATPAPAGHHDGTCQTCCRFHCLYVHAAILTSRPDLAMPCGAMLGLQAEHYQARAPPAQARDTAFPRGPPTLA
jgi:hypothetical protein